jgi:hypothetical protein
MTLFLCGNPDFRADILLIAVLAANPVRRLRLWDIADFDVREDCRFNITNNCVRAKCSCQRNWL